MYILGFICSKLVTHLVFVLQIDVYKEGRRREKRYRKEWIEAEDLNKENNNKVMNF